MVTTDDPESLRREREHIAAQTRIDPNYIPMVAVSARNQRGRVDLVRLFHSLQEMDYLPVRDEIRERVAAMWGVSPAWQGAPEAFGGLSSQTQQLVVMSRVVEADQRMFHEKVFPQLLKAFDITDYEIVLPQPEEKAENTRLSFAQQKISVASQFATLGFDVKLKEQNVDLYEAEFIVSGEAVPTAQMAGEQLAIGIEQQRQLLGEVDEEFVEEDEELQKAIPKHKRKFKGRTGGVTPNWADKAPSEERDIDEYAEARAKKNQLTLSKSWVESLKEKGFTSPVIRELTPDLRKMWFAQNDIEYVATLSPTGITHIEKAVFTDPKKFKRRKIKSNVTELNEDYDDEG